MSTIEEFEAAPVGATTRLPAALDALQAVLDLHQPTELIGHSATWLRCTQGCPTWPCPTIEAIQAAIGGGHE